ncbi:unnamed protein product [Clonostachys rosea f. rosea IK726]|uniref:Enoyl reductase (ER) domain-containing protein n=2 Tax=Bionectria ochroleuca TaxID=29856 RepID=A0A0B7KE41_BIOOC|nr:unnamed protein product [Clonostachys rosea f. rosea IK726]
MSTLAKQYKVVRVAPEAEGQVRLQVRNEELPVLGRDDVLVRVHAASLNYRDTALLRGEYPAKIKEHVAPLSDGAGEVVAVGHGVTRFKKGDRVANTCIVHWVGGPALPEHRAQSVGFSVDGMLAEYAILHENGLVHLPVYLTYIEAASLPCAAVTAWTDLNNTTPLQPGQTVLVQGTGGVALFALQFARVFNARVFAITSSDEKARKLKQLGAEAVINYSTTPDWDEEILRLTEGRGVDKVIDIAGEKTIVKSAASARIGGEVKIVGFASGFGGGLPPIDVLKRSLTVTGSAVGPRLNFEAMLRAMAVHEVHPIIDNVYPFANYLDAYKRLESGQQVGKVVIDISSEGSGTRYSGL